MAISDIEFMGEARDVLGPLTPSQRAVVLWLLTDTDDAEGATTVLATATKLAERAEGLDMATRIECATWLAGKLECRKLAFPFRPDAPNRPAGGKRRR